MTDANLKTTANSGYVQNASGYDIVFTDSTGTTKLDHEIEKYVVTTGEIEMWVRIPPISASSDTTLYMYFDNSSISTSQENKTGVWNPGGATSYRGVWHFAETSGNANDSTSYASNATKTGTPTQGAAGQIGNGISINGTTGNYFSVTNPGDGHLDFGTNSFSYSAWVNLASAPASGSYMNGISKNSISTSPGYIRGLPMVRTGSRNPHSAEGLTEKRISSKVRKKAEREKSVSRSGMVVPKVKTVKDQI